MKIIREYKCPYCGNVEENEYVDLIDTKIFNVTGYCIESYNCSECDEYFYIEKNMKVTETEIRKTKYPMK